MKAIILSGEFIRPQLLFATESRPRKGRPGEREATAIDFKHWINPEVRRKSKIGILGADTEFCTVEELPIDELAALLFIWCHTWRITRLNGVKTPAMAQEKDSKSPIHLRVTSER